MTVLHHDPGGLGSSLDKVVSEQITFHMRTVSYRWPGLKEGVQVHPPAVRAQSNGIKFSVQRCMFTLSTSEFEKVKSLRVND